MIVWYGRRPGSTAPPTAKHAPRFWRTTPVPGRDEARAEALEEALDERDGHPVVVDRAEVDRPARRLRHRRAATPARRGTRARSARATSAPSRTRASASSSASWTQRIWLASDGDERSSSPSPSSAQTPCVGGGSSQTSIPL